MALLVMVLDPLAVLLTIAASRGGRGGEGKDSNPRYGCPYTALRKSPVPTRCLKPLSHLSDGYSAIEELATSPPSIPYRPDQTKLLLHRLGGLQACRIGGAV
jgi:hypothetical protein